MLLLQHATTGEGAVQKQAKRKTGSKGTVLARKRRRAAPPRALELYSFSFQCPSCLTFHKGTIESDTEELQILCLEPLDNLAVCDDRFLVWLAGKQHGMTLYCNFVHAMVGHKASKQMEHEGEHQLYDGRFDQEMIEYLQDERHAKYQEWQQQQWRLLQKEEEGR